MDALWTIVGYLRPVWDLLAGLDREWQILGGGGLCLLVLWLIARKRGAATAGHGALRRQYKKLAKAGVADWEQPYKLLSTRAGWEGLSGPFLMELASRLMERDRIIAFIVYAERHEPVREQIAGLTTDDPELAMRGLSVGLADLAPSLPAREAVETLGFAIQIDPENHMALIDLATEYYATKRYADAMPLLEQAIPLGQQAMTALPKTTPQNVGRTVAAQTSNLSGLTMDRMHEILKIAGEMYDDCVERVSPKSA